MSNISLEKTRRVTLSDIARQAGVSVSTASLVLADKAQERRISQEATLRVRQAAVRLDYSPNLLVRSLQRGRTHVLSFFNGFRSRSPNDLYMDRLSTFIEQEGGRLGYDILVYCDYRRSAAETYRYLNGGRSDGLLFLAPQPGDPLLQALGASRLPTVLINGIEAEGMLSQVRDDVESAMEQVADTLFRLGHRRVAALTNTPNGNPDAGRRVELLVAALASRGVTIPERWIVPADETHPGEAESVLRFLLSETQPPTALFCWHDRLGYELLEHCETLDVSIPGQLSLIGYDGLYWPARTRHQLASVAVSLDSLAQSAVVLLDNLIAGKEEAPARKHLPVMFTPGTTLAAPRL